MKRILAMTFVATMLFASSVTANAPIDKDVGVQVSKIENPMNLTVYTVKTYAFEKATEVIDYTICNAKVFAEAPDVLILEPVYITDILRWGHYKFTYKNEYYPVTFKYGISPNKRC